MLNMVQLRCHRHSFCNFKRFKIKAATSYPVMQKEVDELLDNGTTDPSTGGVGFYSNVFVILKHTVTL